MSFPKSASFDPTKWLLSPESRVLVKWAAAGLIAAVSISLSGVLLQLGRELGLKGCCFTELHVVHITTQICQKKLKKRHFPWVCAFLPNWRNAAKYYLLPGKVQKQFWNWSANWKRSWLKANTQARQTAFLGFGSLICCRRCLIVNFCLDLSF